MIRPLHDCIVVKPDPAEIPSSLLILPPEDTKKGTVVAIGPGKRLPTGKIRPMLVSVGDHVLFSGTIDQTIDISGENYLLMRDKDVIGLV